MLDKTDTHTPRRRRHRSASAAFITLLLLDPGSIYGQGNASDSSAASAVAQIAESTTVQLTERQGQRWSFFLQENSIDRAWLKLSQDLSAAPFAIVGVNVISMSGPGLRPRQTVVCQGGRIVAIGPSDTVDVPNGVPLIDGQGKYLIPGLVDAHAHSMVSNSTHLLNLANGVTTVRDMDGFEWMLQLRDRIAANELLAPTMYVAGHILSAAPMGFYATVVGTPEDARRAVREQVAAGYDFIKIHNLMSPEVFAAVHDEARKHQIDVVGHIPQGLSVLDAVEAGQRTIEHFKGYILDSTLQVTDEDYVQATLGRDVWNTPTFYATRTELRGDEARRAVLDTDQLQFVAASDRADWVQLAGTEPDRLNRLRYNVLEISRTLFRDLRQIDARFLAGTDAGGGMPLLIPGFALHDELREMERLGLTQYEVLETATGNPARAMRRDREFGTIQVGKRADLVLLSANPLESSANLDSIDGVAARGIWLDRDRLDEMLAVVATSYSADGDFRTELELREVDALIDRMAALRTTGFIFRGYDLEELSAILRDARLPARALRVRNLRAR